MSGQYSCQLGALVRRARAAIISSMLPHSSTGHLVLVRLLTAAKPVRCLGVDAEVMRGIRRASSAACGVVENRDQLARQRRVLNRRKNGHDGQVTSQWQCSHC